jgi:hypothetical protein
LVGADVSRLLPSHVGPRHQLGEQGADLVHLREPLEHGHEAGVLPLGELQIDDVVVQIVFAVPGGDRDELAARRMDENGPQGADFGRHVNTRHGAESNIFTHMLTSNGTRLLCRLGFAVLIHSAGTHRAAAQAIPKPDYVTYLPREAVLPVQATSANRQFHLFGDATTPTYHDEAPRDGIDDARERWLRALASRFAPWMVRNSVDFPMNFRRFVEGGEASTLFIDAFDLSQARPRLLETETIDFAKLADAACRHAEAAAREAADTTSDCRLLRLIDRFAPDPPRAATPPQPDLDLRHVMYFDFPGEDPASWNREFEGSVHGSIARKYIGYAKAFVHPFIGEVRSPGFEPVRYELVLQYWFFYPYNDAGNIHEGDWEHINVVVTPRGARGTEPLAADEVSQLLEKPAAPAELVIRRVEYYFHHWVFTADYMTPDIYAPRAEWERQLKALREERVGERQVWRQIRRQAYLDDTETKLNLHPIVFIGGDNRGLQQLVTAPSRLGRASHGSFPFPGLYKDVGPGNTGELVSTHWDIFREPPESTSSEDNKVIRFDNADRLEIVPDWERVLPLVRMEPVARRGWAWLVLPIRFGYPATNSPFAGIVRYAETGNTSILGPAYNGGWNRAGAAAGYERYLPHRLGSYFPASLQDNFRTGWGFFNLTLPTLVTLPPLDIVYRLVTAPSRVTDRHAYPAFFGSAEVPFRFIGMPVGVSSFKPPDTFLNLLGFPELGAPFLQQVIALAGSDTFSVDVINPETDRVSAPYYGISLFLGRRFVSENTLRHSNGSVRSDVTISTLPGLLPLTANLDMWEYTGSLRYNIAQGGLQPFVKAGYGLSWYRLTDATFKGQLLGDGTSRWVRRPSLFHNLLPNTWHVGGGLEFIPVRSVGGLDWGFRGDLTVYSHNLGLKTESGFVLAQDEHVTRVHVAFGTTVSF